LSRKKAQILRYLLLIPALGFALAPVYWMLTISLKTEVDQFATPPPWFGFTPTVAHYYDAFVTRSFGDYLINSAIVAVASTACALVIGTLAAYALARFQLPWRLNRHLSLWILSTRMFPAIVTAVPLFLMMRDVRLLNTRASLIIVHTAFNLPFVVWMMRGFFAELPRDLEEAALVDGDSRLAIGRARSRRDRGVLSDRLVERISICARADTDGRGDDVAGGHCRKSHAV
jgi:multiple sugar transport system permease protein